MVEKASSRKLEFFVLYPSRGFEILTESFEEAKRQADLAYIKDLKTLKVEAEVLRIPSICGK